MLLRQIKTADRKQGTSNRALIDRINELRVENRHLIHFMTQEFFRAKFCDWLGFDKCRRILQLEIGQQLAFRARDKLSRFFSSNDINGFRQIKIRSFTKKICI